MYLRTQFQVSIIVLTRQGWVILTPLPPTAKLTPKKPTQIWVKHYSNASDNHWNRADEHEKIQTSSVRDKRITPERETQWAPVKEKTKSLVREKSLTVADTSRKIGKKRFQDPNIKIKLKRSRWDMRKVRRRYLISMPLKLRELIKKLFMNK